MGFDRSGRLPQNKIAMRVEDFYAARCIDALGAGSRPRNGVIRVSLVHYNSLEDANRLTENLDETLSHWIQGAGVPKITTFDESNVIIGTSGLGIIR